MKAQRTGKHTPACPSSRVHALVDQIVYSVRFFIVLFVCRTRKKAIFIVWVLELLWVNVRLLTTSSLCFPAIEFNAASQLQKTPKKPTLLLLQMDLLWRGQYLNVS